MPARASLASPEDGALARRVAAGDAAAEAELVRRREALLEAYGDAEAVFEAPEPLALDTERLSGCLEALVAWWLGELPEAEAQGIEEHLFACTHFTRA